jgi:hypothetical protein
LHGSLLDQRIGRRFDGARSLVAALVGDDEDAKWDAKNVLSR